MNWPVSMQCTMEVTDLFGHKKNKIVQGKQLSMGLRINGIQQFQQIFQSLFAYKGFEYTKDKNGSKGPAFS